MMECKKALAEAGGEMKKAEELLRIKSGAKATNVAGRIAAEGAVGVYIASDRKIGALVEVNCETDFVAKDVNFTGFVKTVAAAVARGNPTDLDALASSATEDGKPVEGLRQGLVMKLGENIKVRRFTRVSASGKLAHYLHGTRIGVLIDYEGGDEQLGRDLAMHIAASKPLCVDRAQVPAEAIAKEREIYSAQARESGKPEGIVAKMVDGRIAKYFAEVTLLGQTFVKDQEQTIEQLLKAKGAKVHGFYVYVVGEGIEKKKDNFAAEVMAQAQAGST
jgi:elongation factor Ts